MGTPTTKPKRKSRKADVPPAERRLLTEKEAALFLSTSPDSLRMDRFEGNLGIPWVRWGKRGIRYDREILESVIAERTVRPEAAAGGV